MNKVFLSYSHDDGDLVKKVANELGRQYAQYDEFVFETGEDLRSAIRKALDNSSIFVLFASRNSLKSTWVQFESGEAELRRIQALLTNALVYLIDDDIHIEDIPIWLQKGKITSQKSPGIIARDIRFKLDKITREAQHQFFVGRTEDINNIEAGLLPADGTRPPRVVVVFGLPGIGRRSLLKNSIPRILNLNKFIYIRIAEGDEVNDICLKIADKVEPYSTSEDLERIASSIRELSETEALKRISDNLGNMNFAGEFPIFYDNYGIVDLEGHLYPAINQIISKTSPENYYGLVTSRKPLLSPEMNVPVIPLRKLRKEDTKRLISLVANQKDVKLSTGQITALSDYLAGYPPSAYFALEQVRAFGFDLTIDKAVDLVEFRASVFLKHFEEIGMSELDKSILRLLAGYSPLPYSIIVESLLLSHKYEKGFIQSSIVNLVNLTLIYLDEDGLYRIAEPIQNATTRAYGILDPDSHTKIAQLLKEYIYSQDKSDYYKKLELIQAFLRASWLVDNKKVQDSSIFFPSDLIKVAQTYYHSRDYKNAILAGKAALIYRPNSISANNFLVRALIQEGQWEEAMEQLEESKHVLRERDIFFLRGFLERKRRNTIEALKYYELARSAGRRDSAISREISLCHNLLGDNNEAMEYLYAALEKDRDHPFLVDLWAKISTDKGDEPEARKALSTLKIVAPADIYNQRLSRVEFRFGNIEEAEAAAYLAYTNVVGKPTFEILAQLVLCNTILGKTEKASRYMDIMEKKWHGFLIDIQLNLKAQLELQKGNILKAYVICEKNYKKDQKYYQIKEKILENLVKVETLSSGDKQRYEIELGEVRRRISTERVSRDSIEGLLIEAANLTPDIQQNQEDEID